MNITEIIYGQLEEMGLRERDSLSLEEIRSKDGVYLFRVRCRDEFYVLKYFENEKYRREIDSYCILRELDIPTIKFLGYTDRSILLEDLDRSENYRLGIAEDLSDVEVARALAGWYRKFHGQGEKYIVGKKDKFYREIDCITKENIEMIRAKSNTTDNRVWDLIIENLDFVMIKIKSLREVLTYNDFYWTNFAVSKDKKEALMFDYNFLGIGLRYNDIRNVCSSLSSEAGVVFLEEYGEIDEREKEIDEFTGTLVGLIFAYQRPVFPSWGQEPLEAVHNGEMERIFERLLNNLGDRHRSYLGI